MIIIGLGTGRCGTQTFAKMFDLPHEKYESYSHKSDVAPYYLESVENINKNSDARFVCLKRDKQETINSFVDNKIMTKEKAEKYYDNYYKTAEDFESKLPNFKIFKTEELNNPKRIEEFLGKKSKRVDPISKVCPFFSGKTEDNLI